MSRGLMQCLSFCLLILLLSSIFSPSHTRPIDGRIAALGVIKDSQIRLLLDKTKTKTTVYARRRSGEGVDLTATMTKEKVWEKKQQMWERKRRMAIAITLSYATNVAFIMLACPYFSYVDRPIFMTKMDRGKERQELMNWLRKVPMGHGAS